jgi:hypothetical protein
MRAAPVKVDFHWQYFFHSVSLPSMPNVSRR